MSRQTLLLLLVASAAPSTAFTVFPNGRKSGHSSISASLQATSNDENQNLDGTPLSRRNLMSSGLLSAASLAVWTVKPFPAAARLEAVNRPDLLPTEPNVNVIQTEKFLTSGQAKRMDTMLQALERDTGYRVRVLCQAYPRTPGLAIRDYWDLGKDDQKDDKYVVLVVDQFGGKGNVLNFNVGDGVKLALPNIFWNRLTSTYGTIFYVRENGIDFAITNAIEAIVTCLRSEDQFCVSVPDTSPSMRSLGLS